jgi:hypothetical protein
MERPSTIPTSDTREPRSLRRVVSEEEPGDNKALILTDIKVRAPKAKKEGIASR